MRRRDLLLGMGAVGAGGLLTRRVLAQQAKAPLIVVLSNSLSAIQRLGLFQGLADYGYVDGKNVTVQFLTAPTIADVPAYAAQAVARKPDIILTLQSPSPVALKELTSTIPVVVSGIQDPVAVGVAQNYSRPGTNFTGTMLGGPDQVGKVIELAREVLPAMSRLGLTGLSDDPVYPVLLSQIAEVCKAFGIQTVPVETKENDDFPALFDRAAKNGAQALFVFNGGYLKAPPVSVTLANLGIQRRLPVFCNATTAARDGMLFGYEGNGFAMNPDLSNTRRAGYYVDLILKGASPANLPIEGPTNFALIVNLKTAKAMGITVPQSVLFQATEIIS